MGRINWGRVFVCGLAAGLAWSFLSIPILILFGGDIVYAVPRPLVTVTRLGSIAVNVVAGIWAVWLYTAIRPRYGVGPRPAAIAGFSWWLLATIITWQWADLGFLRFRDLGALMVVSLPALIAVVMVAVWPHRETDGLTELANTVTHGAGA